MKNIRNRYSPLPHVFIRFPLNFLQEVAAACIFLATKTEECGRKLRDVARVFAAKLGNKDMSDVATEGKVGRPHAKSVPLSYPGTGNREHPEYHPRLRRSPVRSTLFRFLGGKRTRTPH